MDLDILTEDDEEEDEDDDEEDYDDEDDDDDFDEDEEQEQEDGLIRPSAGGCHQTYLSQALLVDLRKFLQENYQAVHDVQVGR